MDRIRLPTCGSSLFSTPFVNQCRWGFSDSTMRLFKVICKDTGRRLWALPKLKNNRLDKYGTPELFHPLSENIAKELESGEDFQSIVETLETSSAEVFQARKVLPPLPDRGCSQIYACGLNYAKHAREASLKPGRYPTIILKASNSICGHLDDIRIPFVASQKPEVDYEVELAVIIGKTCKDVCVENAKHYIAGFTVANDITARRWQGKKGGSQWARSKSFDTFTPVSFETTTCFP